MYLNFEQALKLIKADNQIDGYASSRISMLIRAGKIKEVFPDFYLKQGDEFINIGKLQNVRLVCEESVLNFIFNNCNDRNSKPVTAQFSNGDTLEFCSGKESRIYLGVSKTFFVSSIRTGKFVSVPIHETRKGLIFFETGNCELTHETVKFIYQ